MKPYSFLFICLILFSCNTRYGYRAKVRLNNNKLIAKKEASIIIDSTIEASVENEYHTIGRLNIDLSSDSLPTALVVNPSPVKESLLKRRIGDTANAEYTLAPKTKRLNTLVETAPWRNHKHTPMSSVTGGISSNTIGIIGLVIIFSGIALSGIAALAGQTGDKLLGFLLFSTMLVFFGLLFLLLALIISIVDN